MGECGESMRSNARGTLSITHFISIEPNTHAAHRRRSGRRAHVHVGRSSGARRAHVADADDGNDHFEFKLNSDAWMVVPRIEWGGDTGNEYPLLVLVVLVICNQIVWRPYFPKTLIRRINLVWSLILKPIIMY